MMKEFEDILEEINHNLEWCDDAYQSRCYRRSHDEITRLRADLAAVTERMSKLDFERTVAELERDSLRAENERLREALGYYAEEDYNGYNGSGACARAALEGVTEPASPWRDIESAPRDGTWIFIYKDSWHGAIKAKWDAIDGVDELFTGWVFQDEFLCIGCAEGCLGYNEDIEDGYMPTHWMPIPEPPND